MKCTNKSLIISLIMVVCTLCTSCGVPKYSMPYTPDSAVSSYNLNDTGSADKAVAFAADLCVTNENVNETSVNMDGAAAAGLFDISNNKVLYAKNVNEQVYPASLTKVMTALVALKMGNSDDVLTASANVKITEAGAQLCGLEAGDTMKLDQALHILLMYSANDVAVMIAEHYGETVEGFANLMNEEAKSIGATNCNFVNPNGLSDDTHYVSTYDMYLIFNEAIKYELFNEIIHMTTYDTVYYNANGESKDISISTTNLYLKGTYESPEGITVIGGKTGTTTAAGHCLVLLAKDTSGNPYIGVVMRSESRDTLYAEMTDLLKLIGNH